MRIVALNTVVSVPTVDKVVSAATVDIVITGAPEQNVVSGATPNDIIPIPAIDVVVTGVRGVNTNELTAKIIVATTSENDIGTAFPDYPVSAIPAVHVIVAGAGVNNIVTAAAVDPIGATRFSGCVAPNLVRAASTNQYIAPLPSKQDIHPFRTNQDVVARIAVKPAAQDGQPRTVPRRDSISNIGLCRGKYRVIARAAVQEVETILTRDGVLPFDQVVPGFSINPIATGPTLKMICPAASKKIVTAAKTRDEIVAATAV